MYSKYYLSMYMCIKGVKNVYQTNFILKNNPTDSHTEIARVYFLILSCFDSQVRLEIIRRALNAILFIFQNKRSFLSVK